MPTHTFNLPKSQLCRVLAVRNSFRFWSIFPGNILYSHNLQLPISKVTLLPSVYSFLLVEAILTSH